MLDFSEKIFHANPASKKSKSFFEQKHICNLFMMAVLIALIVCVILFRFAALPTQPVEICESDTTPSSDLLETPKLSESSAAFSSEMDYILNTNTLKFHLPSCPSVEQIKETNKLFYTGTRETVIEMGYSPCKRCRP